jgi:tripartite-type tricarboxylate transporter receptor subunit TctC
MRAAFFRRRGLLLGLASAFTLLAQPLPALAQVNPATPVRIVVPYPAGSTPDSLARILSEGLTKRINRPVVIDNRAGASGMIGAKFVSDAAPDGNTLLMFTPAWPAARIFQKTPPVPVPDGLEPVTIVAEGAFSLVGSGKFQVNTFDELISHARANPGKVNFATVGQSDIHLYLLLMQKEKNFTMEGIQYKGSSEYLPDLVSNNVQVAITPPYTVLPFVKDGKMRVLAVSGDNRMSIYPDAPTFKELGLPQIHNNWFTLFAPRNTSPELVSKLNADFVALIRSPEIAKRIQEIYFDPVGSSAEAARQIITTEIKEWSSLARSVGVEPQ